MRDAILKSRLVRFASRKTDRFHVVVFLKSTLYLKIIITTIYDNYINRIYEIF